MDNQEKATPRPWDFNDNTWIEDEKTGKDKLCKGIVISGDEGVVLEFYGRTKEDYSNAELIVKAVNSYDMLLATLKDVENLLPSHCSPIITEAKKRLRQAIAKAEGR